jgi:hypothetical protein
LIIKFDAEKISLETIVDYAFHTLHALDLKVSEISIEDVVKKSGVKMDAFMSATAQTITNLYAQGKDKLANAFKDTKNTAAMQTLMLGAILCKNNGISSSQMLDILSAAGVQ